MGVFDFLKSIFGGAPPPEREPFDREALALWQASPERPVTQPRNRCAKACLASIGRPIEVIYSGRQRTIRPLRVFSKPEFRRTYVEAEEEGTRKTFNVDEMKLPKGKKA